MAYEKYPCCECGEMTSPDGVFCSACEEVSLAARRSIELDAQRYRKLQAWLVEKQDSRWVRIGAWHFEKYRTDTFDEAVDALPEPK